MIKIENEHTYGWQPAIYGMRNPMNSWDKSDSLFVSHDGYVFKLSSEGYSYIDKDFNDIDSATLVKLKQQHFCVGEEDLKLMKKLSSNGPVHAKFKRMIVVYADITAPLYFWKEFDTYKVGTVANSCSTMHKIHAEPLKISDFSFDRLIEYSPYYNLAEDIVDILNIARKKYVETKDKRYWEQMIQLLPSSYNQKRTVMLNYEVLSNIYEHRKDHKLTEWLDFCDWIKTLPYRELIIGGSKDN